ncbi:MAG TPA: ATP-binding cassette domain-containing protein, partial [Bacteroidales bacterium]|nr:ATP-binding cassette domain-containing protein [Bacteroidales bacterium]
MFAVQNLSVHFTGTSVFEDVTFLIQERDRVGLVGRNGAGKTTLMRIICGLMEPEQGIIVIPDNKTVGYLPQELETTSNSTVFAEAMLAFAMAVELGHQIEALGKELELRSDTESPAYSRLITRLSDANEQYHLIGGHTRQADAEKVLLGLGFERSDFDRPLREFSSGWQMRVEMAKILLQ